MKRVMIVGGPGSGKSTLARALGPLTGLPVFHMDHIHHMPGWVERPKSEKDRMTREVHGREAWIFEGGHSRTYAERLARADTLIWLDLPVTLRLLRVIRRTLRYRGRSRPDLPEGCPERLNIEMLRFLAYILRSRRPTRAKIQAMAGAPPPHVRVVHLTNVRAVDSFLGALRTSRQRG
ncbi:MAG: DNA topology modulation protein FlaR [Pseudomonadota bacterium]